MPVGNSDQGVGLWSGQIMFTMDNAINYIDWWHEKTEGEDFDHEGDLLTYILSPTISIGLSDYWMLSITQQIGHRGMVWGREEVSIHHRTENTSSDFLNAIGGLLGDTQINFRYLAINTGAMDGYRFFIGSGFILPSKNTLTSDPFFLDGSEVEEHRHFSISEGAKKGLLEIQLFKKQIINPVFYGVSFRTQFPFEENKYGFRPSNYYELTISSLLKPIQKIKVSIGMNLGFMHTTISYWNGIESPNSNSSILLPGISFIKNLNIGIIILGIQKPFFLTGSFSGSDGIEQKVNAFQISLGYRKILKMNIPFLY